MPALTAFLARPPAAPTPRRTSSPSPSWPPPTPPALSARPNGGSPLPASASPFSLARPPATERPVSQSSLSSSSDSRPSREDGAPKKRRRVIVQDEYDEEDGQQEEEQEQELAGTLQAAGADRAG